MGTLRNYELLINGQVYIGRMKTPSQQLRCVFDVIASYTDSNATADIRLYNLKSASSPKSRDSDNPALEFKSGDSIRLDAGYSMFDSQVDAQRGVVVNNVKDEIGTVFIGTIKTVFRERDGANIVTRILCRSGESTVDTGVANSSYGQGVTLYDVLVDLSREWGKRLVVNKEKCQTKVMVSGYMTDGDITREIDTLAKAYGFQWTNFNGQLNVTFPADARTTTKHLVSQTTGMIGIPELNGGVDGVFVDVGVRLNPFVNINDRIEIDATFQTFNTGLAFVQSVESHASGEYNVLGMRFRGDNWGGNWRLDINGLKSGSTAEATLDNGAKLIWGAKVSQEFRTAVRQVAKELGIDANWMMATMAFETGNSFLPYKRNTTSGAVGLLQFTKTGLSSPAMSGYTQVKIARMSDVEQIKGPVKDYFSQYKGKINNLGDTYMAVFAPRDGLGKPDSTILYTAPSAAYYQNQGLDATNKGYITRGDCIVRVNKAFKQGQQYAAG